MGGDQGLGRPQTPDPQSSVAGVPVSGGTDLPAPVVVPPPTEPGFYKYSGGNQTMVFSLHEGKWRVFMDNGMVFECEWGYIEQALSVWDLVPI